MDTLAILHVSNSFNYGSAMMCINFINYISKKEKYRFITDAKTEEDLIRYKKESNITEIEKINTYKESTNTFFINKIFNLLNRNNFITKEVGKKDPSAVIILGGDDLTETYSGASIISELLKIYQLTMRFPVFLVCQNIGPFQSWRRFAAKIILKRCSIYTRDDLTYNYLSDELKLDTVHRSSDLAFLKLPHQQAAETDEIIISKYGLKKDEYITLVPSGLVSQYTENIDSYIESWKLVINQLSQIEEIRHKKIVLLSHVLKPEYVDDRKVVNDLFNKIEDSDRKKIIPITDEMLPSQARQILGNGYFTITGRMHAAVSTLNMGKPAIALSYSLKYEGLIGEMMDLSQLIIKSDRDDVWSNKVIVDSIIDRVQYILTNYDELSVHINSNMKKNAELVMHSITDIHDKVGSY